MVFCGINPKGLNSTNINGTSIRNWYGFGAWEAENMVYAVFSVEISQLNYLFIIEITNYTREKQVKQPERKRNFVFFFQSYISGL